MAINIQSLFQDIIETPAQRQQRMLQEGILKGRELTSGLTGLARTQAPLVAAMAMNMPQQQEALRRGIGGMLGLDVRSESEKVQDALKNVDPNNPQSLLQAAQMIQGLGLGTQAAVLRQEAARVKAETNLALQKQQEKQSELNKISSQRTALLEFINLADIEPDEKQAYIGSVESGLYDGKANDLLERLSPNTEGKYKVVGNNIFNLETSEFITPPSNQDVISGITAGEFDVGSIQRYRDAISKATSEAERQAAIGLLLDKAPDGWSWSYDETNKKYVNRPTSGKALQETTQQIRVANSAGINQRESSQNSLDIIKDIKEQVETAASKGKDLTGTIFDIAFSFIPGQDQYVLSSDINTIKANLGYNALKAARESSANGASGFGQLTERELATLERLITELNVGLPKDEFIDRLNTLNEWFTNSRDRAKSDWDIDQWIGIKEPATASKQTTTSSGRFTITEQ